MLKGTTYMVRPFIEPRNSSSSLARISAGAFQLFVGPASASSAEQMKVRSSTRATSLGSECAQYEPGRLAGSSSVKVPASTSCSQRSACSSSDPSNQWTLSGWHSSTISSTHASSRALRVGACTSATLRLQTEMGCKPAYRRLLRPPEPDGPEPVRPSDLRGAEPHVDLRTEAHPGGATIGVEVEIDPLTLAEGLEERALERVGGERQVGPVGLVDHHALPGEGVVHADDALHAPAALQGFCTLPALRQEVHTWRRFGEPFTTARTFCTLGFQRRFVRRCEWLMRMPNCGFLPHTSQTDAMTRTLAREPDERSRIAAARVRSQP